MPFDVFLCHNTKDKPTVRELGEALKRRGLSVWLDEWELVPGRPWQEALEEIVQTTKAAAVLVGRDARGPWQDREIRGCLTEFVNRGLSLIPVLLPGAPSEPELPVFLKEFTWVDLRSGLTDEGLDRLQWGITGVKPETLAAPSQQAVAKPGASESSAVGFRVSYEPSDRFLADLRQAIKGGELRDSRLARVVLACCQPLAPFELSRKYNFEFLVAAIHDADELIQKADAWAGKLEGRESACGAVSRVIVSLSEDIMPPSGRLRTLVVRVAEEIFALPEIGIPFRWPPGGKDDFYNVTLVASLTDIEVLLEGYLKG